MAHRFLLVFLLLLAAPSAASAEGVPWEITGTSSAAVPASESPGRVELRLFTKADHVIVRTGFSYLSRSDFYVNPGVSLDVAWYPWEFLAFELSGTGFFSQLSSTAEALRKSTGLLPDSQKPLVRAMGGARFAFAYGKLLIEELDTVVHVDASVAAHVGLLVTDEAPNFGGDVGLGIQVRAFERLLVWIEGTVLVTYERRSTSSVASGPQGTIGLGLLL